MADECGGGTRALQQKKVEDERALQRKLKHVNGRRTLREGCTNILHHLPVERTTVKGAPLEYGTWSPQTLQQSSMYFTPSTVMGVVVVVYAVTLRQSMGGCLRRWW